MSREQRPRVKEAVLRKVFTVSDVPAHRWKESDEVKRQPADAAEGRAAKRRQFGISGHAEIRAIESSMVEA
jgi:hypothetical protein